MAFSDKKMPDENLILKPKEIKKYSPPSQEQTHIQIQRPRKQSSVNLEGYDELKKLEEETLNLMKEQEAFSLAEKVLKRQQEEQDKKKREILKQLHKSKNIDLDKFLTRAVGFEQKKNFDLEQKRFKQLEEESKFCKDQPLLSHKTIEMCKTLNKKPIYERAKEILEKREENLKQLKNKDYKYNKKLRNKGKNLSKNKSKSKSRKVNNSMDNIVVNKEKKRKRKEYIINDKIKNKKMNYREIKDYYIRQNEWKNKVEEKKKMKGNNLKKKKDNEFVEYFHPQISQGSIEIINAKNEANENNMRYLNTDFNNNYYYAENDIYSNNINFGKNVYDRLYEDNALYEIRKNEYKNKSMCSFQPFTNKNKYKQIHPKYNDINLNRKGNTKRTRNNKNILKGAKSVEVEKNNAIDINDKNASIENNKKAKEKDINEPWTNTLLKLKNKKNSSFDDISYRLNIRQASAWNENDVNTVPYKEGSKEIVKFFI